MKKLDPKNPLDRAEIFSILSSDNKAGDVMDRSLVNSPFEEIQIDLPRNRPLYLVTEIRKITLDDL